MRKKFNVLLSVLLAAVLTVVLSSYSASANETETNTLGKSNYSTPPGFETEAEAPPAPVIPKFPYPVKDFKIENRGNHAALSLETAEKVDLTILYGASNRKDGVKEINKKNAFKFESVNIPLENGTNFINLKLSNDSFDFATVLYVGDGTVKNELNINSEYTFLKKGGSFLITPAGYETEPNNTTSSATNTTNGDDNYGTFYGGDTVDYYKYTLSYRAFVNFYLGSIPSGSDYDIYVYKSTDLTNPVWKGESGGNADEVGVYVDLSAGTYYIKVVAFSNPRGDLNYLMRWRISKHWPVLWSTVVSQEFYPNGVHNGLDIAPAAVPTKVTTTGCYNNAGCYKGEPVAAMYDGTISLAQDVTGYGKVIYISHNIDGTLVQTRYGHLYGYIVTSGTVKAGQQIGYMGNTGDVSGGYGGTHTHFETRQCVSTGCTNANSSSTPVNPRGYLPGY